MVLRGWVVDHDDGEDTLQLLCNGQAVEAGVVRIEREDVRAATGLALLQCGFEIELPTALWALVDGQGRVALSVTVNGHPLSAPVVPLTREDLLAALEAQRLLEADPAQAERSQGVRERQYRNLLLLEHVAAAGLWADLTEAQRSHVQAQADRFGLRALLADDQAEAAAPALGEAAATDQTSVTVWSLLRDFNQALGDGAAAPAAVLAGLLERRPVHGAARHQFLLALIPFFCARGQYDSLRPWLDVARLRELARADNAWALSLLLPERVAAGDLAAAAALLDKLAAGTPGWLNTECVAEALRRLQRDWRWGQAPAPMALKLLDRLMALLDAQGASYWGRSHDKHLVEALVTALDLCPGLPEGAADRLHQTALRLYVLTPVFWQHLLARQPEPARWHWALREAHANWQRLEAALRQPATLSLRAVLDLLPSLSAVRLARNRDADILLRELVQAVLPELPQAAAEDVAALHGWLAGLGMTEPLRLAAHPLATPLALASAAALPDRVRAATGVGHMPARAALCAVLAALRAGGLPAQPGLGATDLRLLSDRRHDFVGVRLSALQWLLQRGATDETAGDDGLALLREAWVAAFDDSLDHAVPPAALLSAWALLAQAQAAKPTAALGRLVAEWDQRLAERYGGVHRLAALPNAGALSLRRPDLLRSTLVVVYSCRRNLTSRVAQIRATWAQDLDALGIPWLVVVGDGDGRLEGDVLALPVSDAYECLPDKTIALIRWVVEQTDFEHLFKIDDDCHLAVQAFLAESPQLAQHYLGRRLHRAEGGTDRRWHQARSASPLAATAIDKSPEPSVYADGGAGYALSRFAMARLLAALRSTAGARLSRSAYMEDKLVGDLLALCGFSLSSTGYETLVRRRFGAQAVPVNAYQNMFLPGPLSPTLVSHLDDAAQLPAVQQGMAQAGLTPQRLWPTHVAPRLGGVVDTNQLELLSGAAGVRALHQAPVLLVAVARNERLLLPHFLAHYRGLGVRHFVLVDNLSDDGSREYLLDQPDVVLYSADTEYRHSHYGVSWQQAVLGAHALGKWVVLADIDEFLVYPGCEQQPLAAWLAGIQAGGHDAVQTLMVDMYPEGPLQTADFAQAAPFEVARHFDRRPLLRWHLGSGCYSNGPTWLSGLRHRLIPDSAPNLYTSQKIAVFRYQPWVRLSEGLHYASNLTVAPLSACLAHFKYHAGFQRKVMLEVARKQHFNGAEEYQKYLAMVAETSRPLADPRHSMRYDDSTSFAHLGEPPQPGAAGQA